MENKKNNKLAALIILGLLTALGLAVEIIAGIRYSSHYSSGAYLNLAAYAAMSLLLLYYAMSGYKKPHGNLMKYLFLLFAVCCLCGILAVRNQSTIYDVVYNDMRGVVVLLTAFVAGRLDHFKQNVIIMSFIGVLMLASSMVGISYCSDVFSVLYTFTYFLLWIDLIFAYIIRFKEHKEAGLADKE